MVQSSMTGLGARHLLAGFEALYGKIGEILDQLPCGLDRHLRDLQAHGHRQCQCLQHITIAESFAALNN